MNQRPRPKVPAKNAEPSDRTLILRPGEEGGSTQAMDPRSTFALKGEEAKRMREATQAMPIQAPPEDEPTQGLPLQVAGTQEPTVAMQAPVAPPPALPEQEPATETLKLRLEDISWVAGESPDPHDRPGEAAVDPTSRIRVSRSEMSKMMQVKESAMLPPESRSTIRTPPAQPKPAPGSAAVANGSVLDEAEAGTSMVPVVQAAEQTLRLKTDAEEFQEVIRAEAETGKEAAAASIPSASSQEEPTTAMRIPAEARADATLVLKHADWEGTVPILKPAAALEEPTSQMPMPQAATAPIAKPEPAPGTMIMPPVEIRADATLVLKPEEREGTVPIVKPAAVPEESTTQVPVMESATAPIVKPQPVPPTMLMPQVEERAEATLVLKPEEREGTVPIVKPAVDVEESTTQVPVLGTATTPIVKPEPVPATMIMPQVEARADATLVLRPEELEGKVSTVEAAPQPEQTTSEFKIVERATAQVEQPTPVPATMLMPQVEARADATLVLRPEELEGKVSTVEAAPQPEQTTSEFKIVERAAPQVEKPAPVPATMVIPQVEERADATLVLRPEELEGTVSTGEPTAKPEQTTSEFKIVERAAPQVEKPAPVPATMVMPQVEERADATLVLRPEELEGPVSTGEPTAKPEQTTSEFKIVERAAPQVEKPAPVPATMVMPQVETEPKPAPVPATMVMPQVETEPKPAPVPATMVMPQVESKLLRDEAVGPGGTVPVMRPGTAVPPVPVPDPAATGPGGTVQLLKPEVPEKPAPTGGTLPAMKAMLPPALPPAPPQAARPASATVPVESPAPASQPGTLRVPVEELSRLSEVAPLSSATAFSTRLMPQQPPAAAPPLLPPPQPAALKPPAAGGTGFPAPPPVERSSHWKVWTGVVGIAVLGGAGAVLWLRPDLLGMGGAATKPHLFAGGAEGPRHVVPPALKAVKEKADAGDAASMRYLGTCYANGLGVPRDIEEAKRWFRRAAEAGSQAAREELANLQRQER